MQTTPKARATATNSSHQRNSPQSENNNSPQPAAAVVRHSPRYSVPTASSSSNQTTYKAPRDTLAHRNSPRTPLPQKKRPNRVAELETQIAQLENDLNIVKDQLCSSETSKKQAQEEIQESNQKVLALSIKLEELLRKSHALESPEKPDHSLPSEAEVDQRQHSNDLVALASALDEIKHLKLELEIVSESAQLELHKSNENLKENLLLVEDMKNELSLCKESEAHAQALVGETLMQLESAKKTVETLRSGGCKVTETCDCIVSELEESRARVKFLEELVNKLKDDVKASGNEAGCQTELEKLEKRMKLEVQELKSALETAEMRYNEEQARSTEQTRNAFEIVERIKSLTGQREAELEAELRKSKYLMEELKANMMDKETELQGICEENEDLRMKLENALLGHRRQEKEINEEEMVPEVEMARARAAEAEALMKVGYMVEEVDKSNKKAARVTEQLEAAQNANGEMEAELRRLKVQSDQWRKAAEAAAAMLNNGQLMERTGSMDSSPMRGTRISSRYADDLDDDLLKKKNANMLKRIGDLWKKPHK